MPLDSKNNAPASASTPANARKSLASESQFLARQAEDARTAISRTADDLKHDLVHGVDPRAWVQVAPWTTLATAAVAGFIAATAAVPSKQQQTLRRLARIERAINANGSNNAPPSNGHSPGTTRNSILMTLAMQALRIVQPMVVSAITGALSGKAGAPSPKPENAPPSEKAASDSNQSETGTPPPT